MINGILVVEATLQIGDKTRLDGSKSFITKGESPVTLVEIDPGDGSGYVTVTDSDPSNWYLDWVYSGASRTIQPQIRITTSASPAVTQTSISLVTAADDYLFSSDDDLVALEPDVMKWIPDGRASWLNIHRAAQLKIMDWLNKAGITDANDNPLTKAAVIEVDEVKYWSRDWALALIYKSVQNVKGDVFAEKATFYFGEAGKASDRARLRLDTNYDGQIEKGEGVGLTSATLIRA